jgi:hypothetical protein
MGSKDPTPRADALRAQREARFGHLQAKADAPAKLIPYAGKAPGAREDRHGNKPPNTKPPRQRRKYKRKIA